MTGQALDLENPPGSGLPFEEGHRFGHPSAWLVWAASAGCVALLTRNPWQLILIGAIGVGLRWAILRKRPGRLELGLFGSLVTLPAILNFLLSRTGSTVLFRVSLPLVGGAFTLEALLFGLIAGVQISSLLAVMMAFGDAVTAADLLRRIPRILYPAGLTASIGLTFAPQARASFNEMREAQIIRGYEPRGWRDLPEIIVPLVVMTVENALALGETLATRGWGSGQTGRGARWAFTLGWLALGLGLMGVLVEPNLLLPCLLLSGSGLVALWVAGRIMPRASRFVQDVWSWHESVVVGLALGVATIFALLTALAPAMLLYYPYPVVSWPPINLPLLGAVLLLAAPWVVLHHD